MKKTILASAFAAVGLIALAPAAYAVDGTVSVSGAVSSTTCTINSGSPSFTVSLPKASTASLGVGQVSGRTPFSIKLTNCTLEKDVTRVGTFFENGPTVNSATGRLTNQNTGTGAAANVEIGLLNNTFGRVQLGGTYTSQNSGTATFANNAATLNYYAQYEQNGTAATTAGSVSTTVQYTLVYQ